MNEDEKMPLWVPAAVFGFGLYSLPLGWMIAEKMGGGLHFALPASATALYFGVFVWTIVAIIKQRRQPP